MENPYNPAIMLNNSDMIQYSFRRCLIESLYNGTDVILSEGILSKQILNVPGVLLPQINLSDSRTNEGWKHEN